MSFKGISIGRSLPDKKPEKCLKEISEQGFDFFLMCVGTKGTERKRIDRKAPVLKKLLKKYSLKPYLHLPDLTHLGCPSTIAREGSMKELFNILESFSRINCENAVIHLDGRAASMGWDEEKIKKIGIDSLRRLRRKANDLNIRVALENIPRDFSSSLEKILQISKKAKTKICLDTGHAVISGYSDEEMCDFIKKNKDTVTDFHLQDTLGKEDMHLPIGVGVINFELILRCLRKIGWKGTLCLEYGSYLMEGRKRVLDLLKNP